MLKVVACAFGILCIFQSGRVHAYVPVFTTQETLYDIQEIQDPMITQVFFGELTHMPHTYEVVAKEPFTLSLELRTPKTASSTQSVSAIVIKVPERGKVEEVTRLLGKDATWESKRDELTYDVYLRGATYTGHLEPGTYRIEVHTPDNGEKYMLRIGTEERMTLGYTEVFSRLNAVKEFYGTSYLWLIVTPYVYVPLILCILLVGALVYMRRRYINQDGVVT